MKCKRSGTGRLSATNEKNARKKLVRKINANFGERDIAFTATYPVDGQPADEKQAYRDIRNFLRRIRAMRARQNLPELKYVYITEATGSERYGRRYHHHVIMSGDGMDREAIEASWTQKHKGTCNTRRYQHQAKHWSGFALYLRADKRERGQHRAMRRRWCCSKTSWSPKLRWQIKRSAYARQDELPWPWRQTRRQSLRNCIQIASCWTSSAKLRPG